MEYKYMKEQIKGAEFLTDEYPNIQSHKDIYIEFVEVLKKAQAFDEVVKAYEKEMTPESLGFMVPKIIWSYWESVGKVEDK